MYQVLKTLKKGGIRRSSSFVICYTQQRLAACDQRQSCAGSTLGGFAVRRASDLLGGPRGGTHCLWWIERLVAALHDAGEPGDGVSQLGDLDPKLCDIA